MLNYEVDPALLTPLLPRGTELDDWKGRRYVSVVGFLFLDTKVLGVPVPFHRRFEEVNLRFYVRRRAPEGWRRAVVFIRELVPRAAVALAARWLYNEKYVALPMGHRLERAEGGSAWIRSARYEWGVGHGQGRLVLRAAGAPTPMAAASEERFVVERHWGYTVRRDGGTIEYRVEHPPWNTVTAMEARLEGEGGPLYGEPLAPFLRRPPVSAFLADGSPVAVFRGVRIEG
jgi:uncharacterized protein YqjF (DUF2071 family)